MQQFCGEGRRDQDTDSSEAASFKDGYALGIIIERNRSRNKDAGTRANFRAEKYFTFALFCARIIKAVQGNCKFSLNTAGMRL